MYDMEKIVRPPFLILDFKFPAFFVIIVSSIIRLSSVLISSSISLRIDETIITKKKREI